MKKTMLTSIAMFVGLGVSTTSTAQSVFFSADLDGVRDPVIDGIPAGGMFTAHIYADIDDMHGGLIGWGVEADYDPTKAQLKISCCETDPQWILPETIDTSVSGKVSMVDGRFAPGISAPPSIYLGNISFEITDEMGWTLSMQDVFPDDDNFDGFVAADGFVYDGSIEYLSTQVNAIPIPAAAYLFGSGLLGLIGVARRTVA